MKRSTIIRARQCRGFTLLELLIVVILLGILAAIAIPMFTDQSEAVEQAAFISSLKALASSIEQYRAVNYGAYPLDVMPGIRPPGMEEYFSTATWSNDTPIGGKWDWEGNAVGVTAGISVLGTDKSREFMAGIDSKMDDGNLSTGSFRANGGTRYTYILVP